MNNSIIELGPQQPTTNLHPANGPFPASFTLVGRAMEPSQPALLPTDPPPPAPELAALAPWFRKRTRNGKIARLPKLQRDIVNRMLLNNIPLKKIAGALAELDITVTERNISNWKTRGGYREWCLAQNHAVQMQLHQDNLTSLLRKENAAELSEVGLQAAATQLSQFFLTPQADLLVSDPREYERRLSMLARVNAQLKALQEYRDKCGKSVYQNPERLRREAQQEYESIRYTYSSQIGDSAKCPDIPHRNFLPAT